MTAPLIDTGTAPNLGEPHDVGVFVRERLGEGFPWCVVTAEAKADLARAIWASATAAHDPDHYSLDTAVLAGQLHWLSRPAPQGFGQSERTTLRVVRQRAADLAIGWARQADRAAS